MQLLLVAASVLQAAPLLHPLGLPHLLLPNGLHLVSEPVERQRREAQEDMVEVEGGEEEKDEPYGRPFGALSLDVGQPYGALAAYQPGTPYGALARSSALAYSSATANALLTSPFAQAIAYNPQQHAHTGFCRDDEGVVTFCPTVDINQAGLRAPPAVLQIDD